MDIDPAGKGEGKGLFRVFRRGTLGSKKVSKKRSGALSHLLHRLTGGRLGKADPLKEREVSMQRDGVQMQALLEQEAEGADPIGEFQEELEEVAITRFVRSTGLKGRAQHLFRKFLEKIIGGLKDKAKASIYAGAYKNIRGRKASEKLASIREKKAGLLQQMDQLMARAKEGGFSKKNIRQKGTLRKQMKALQAAEQKCEAAAEKHEHYQELATGAQKQLIAIGGEKVEITQKEEELTLSGMQVRAKSFHQYLEKIGMQQFSVKLSSGDSLTGFAIDEEQYQMSELARLGMSHQCGWQRISAPDGKLLLVETHQLQQLIDEGRVERHGGQVRLKERVSYAPVLPPKNPKTILLTSGSIGNYEMHKREMLTFLLMGHSVMGLNLRGVEESTGKPTESGYERDMEAGYQFLASQGVADKDLVIKALCFSGGPAAHLHSRHPRTHLILDQSYASMEHVVRKELLTKLNSFIKKADPGGKLGLKARLQNWCIAHAAPIAKLIAKLVSPRWSPKKALRSIDGQAEVGFVGLLRTKDDHLMSKKEDGENRAALLQMGTVNFRSYEMSGGHADSWVKEQSTLVGRDERVLPLGRNLEYYVQQELENPLLAAQERQMEQACLLLRMKEQLDEDDLAAVREAKGLLSQVSQKITDGMSDEAVYAVIKQVAARWEEDEEVRALGQYLVAEALGITYMAAPDFLGLAFGNEPEQAEVVLVLAEAVKDRLEDVSSVTTKGKREEVIAKLLQEAGGGEEVEWVLRVSAGQPRLQGIRGDAHAALSYVERAASEIDLSEDTSVEEAERTIHMYFNEANFIPEAEKMILRNACLARLRADNRQEVGKAAMRDMLARCG